MGASGWFYATPYDPDPEAALQRLRDDTFAVGDYQKPWEAIRLPAGLRLPWSFRFLLAAARLFLLTLYVPTWLARGGRGPRTIEEALLDAREDGTHSILDITHVADVREFAAAVPVGRKRLLDLFGTTEPTVDQVSARLGEIQEGLERWEAVYLVVYRDGRPEEIAFIGCSGD